VRLTGDWRKDLVNIALTQVGYEESSRDFVIDDNGDKQGYTRYGGWYGKAYDEWCAMFVHWCMRRDPTANNVYPTIQMTGNNAYCPTIASWFKNNGLWANGGYTNLVMGDTIFFDWQGDGEIDHIGIVIGQDGRCVYTVEGNSGDSVEFKYYDINSAAIAGYGLMDYE